MALSDLRQMRAFVILAEDLNFHKASERLYCSQPALTRLIKTLEDQISCQLLRRTTRTVELTSAGRAFLSEARIAVLHGDKAVTFAREAAKGRRGYLSVAYSTFAIGAGFPEVITAFRASNPDVSLTVQGMSTDEQLRAIAEGRVDIGFGIPVSDDNLNVRVSMSVDPLNVIFPDDHKLASTEEIRLSELRDEAFVLGSWSIWRPYRELINSMCMQYGHFIPRIEQEATETHTVLALVAARLGVTILPRSVKTWDHTGLAARPIAHPGAVLETAAVWDKENRSEVLRSFVGVLRRYTAANRAGSRQS